jgi:hypothetical protein
MGRATSGRIEPGGIVGPVMLDGAGTMLTAVP